MFVNILDVGGTLTFCTFVLLYIIYFKRFLDFKQKQIFQKKSVKIMFILSWKLQLKFNDYTRNSTY